MQFHGRRVEGRLSETTQEWDDPIRLMMAYALVMMIVD